MKSLSMTIQMPKVGAFEKYGTLLCGRAHYAVQGNFMLLLFFTVLLG